MKTYTTHDIKNVVLLGASGSGKTTLAEAMAFDGGVIDRRQEASKTTTRSRITPTWSTFINARSIRRSCSPSTWGAS